MIDIDRRLTARDLLSKIERVFVLSGSKLTSIRRDVAARGRSPVFTVFITRVSAGMVSIGVIGRGRT